jgi:predicted ATPase/DNA-binding CsgD family transcriptional regulator
MDMPQNNLPLPLSSLVGRTEAMARMRRLLADTRLLTLTGPGGVGKTRLALEVASALLDSFADGVWWVDLAPLSDDALVAHAVAQTLELRDDPARSKVTALGDYVQDKEVLLVLDNCEHLIAGCAKLADQLLSRAPRLVVVATSREPLRIGGETVWSVPPLSLPCLDGTVTPESVVASEAGQLFLVRAQAVQPDFRLTDAVARAVTEVCCRLDGIPLAIELAAARVPVVSAPQIAARLDDLFQLLSKGRRNALPRHQTLEAAIEWSYDLLTPREQKLFERLAVFAGFGLAAAEAVAGDPSNPEALQPTDMLDLLSQLVTKSLVVRQPDEPDRYRMLDTIRQYAWQRLSTSGELELVRQRHLSYYLELAERGEAKLLGADQVEWIKLLELEHDNLRAALAWSQASEAREAGLRLAAGLAAFWLRAGYLGEGGDWLKRALAACREVSPVRVKALSQVGRLALRLGDYEQALAFARQSLALSRHLGDKQGMARALGLVGWITHAQGDRGKARSFLEEGLALARESGEERTLARALLLLGDLRLRQGAHGQAAILLQESLERYQQLGDHWSMAWALCALGELARRQGDLPRAVARLELSLVLFQALDSKPEIPYALEALGLAATDQGRTRQAVNLWGAASGVRHGVHAPLPPAYEADYAPAIEQARSTLGTEAFAAAWAEGWEMALAKALALAREEAEGTASTLPMPPPASTEPSQEPLSGPVEYELTPREGEVLRLVARGLTDAQIAVRLVISPRTVGKHVQSIYSKLDLHSRSAATRWALEHDLG